MLTIKSAADSAQIESEDVAAVSVLRTGDNDMSAKNISIDDLIAFIPSTTFLIRTYGAKNSLLTIKVALFIPTRTSVDAMKQFPCEVSQKEATHRYKDEEPRIQGLVVYTRKDTQKDEDRCQVLGDRTAKKN
jgi:hypothetical protein